VCSRIPAATTAPTVSTAAQSGVPAAAPTPTCAAPNTRPVVRVNTLPQDRPEPMPVSIVYAHRINLLRHVEAFMDWIATTMHPHLAD
jgi:DNA-binding transcriptional LysR family regulator